MQQNKRQTQGILILGIGIMCALITYNLITGEFLNWDKIW